VRKKSIGRVLRSHPLSARLLTEYRVRQMVRSERSADLARCMEFATHGSVAVDVGASVGNYALAMGKSVGRHGHVIAIEANPSVFDELIRRTWSSRVSPLNLAASSQSGWARMSVPLDETGAQMEPLGTLESRYKGSSRQLDVRCVRLDDLVGGPRPVSLVKIDVEGHESDVLLGATELLERDRPTLVIEIEQRHLSGRSVADVVEWLTALGYACHGIRGRDLIPWSEYDIERDQLQWLSGNEPDQPNIGHIGYINNFLFRPSNERSRPLT
jgi:FkbM family methyltransferase